MGLNNKEFMNNQIEEDEIDLKELFATIYKYKFSIILITIITTLIAAAYIYFKPDIYKAETTIEISSKSKPSLGDDILSAALSSGAQDISTEIEIIKSRFVNKLALKNVDFIKHYYGVKNLKKIELYKNTPLDVNITKGYNIEFIIKPTSSNKFILEVKKTKDENGTEWDFYREVKFGELIKDKHFNLTVNKIAKLDYDEYRFLAKDPKYIADEVRKNLQVSQASKKASIIKIALEDNVRLRATEYVNAVANAYLKQSIERKTIEATKKLDFIDNQLKQITKSLQTSAKDLEEFKKSSNTVSISSKADIVIQRSAELEVQLADVSLKRKIIESLYNDVKSGKGLESISIVGMGNDGSSIISMVKNLQDAIIKRKILLQDFTTAHPEVIKVSNTITQLKHSILKTLKNMLILMKEKETLLKNSIAKEKKQIEKLPENERVLSNLKRQFLANEKIYSYLIEKRSEVAIAKAATINKNRVLDNAILPRKPIKPKRKLVIIVGLIVGLILGIFIAFLRAFLSNKIESKHDIEKATTVPIVANIPFIKDDANSLVVLKSPKSMIAEAFRAFRTNIQFMVQKERSYVISLTSTISGEGKTTVSMNLAGIISITNKRVILLHLDMRKPTLHEKFKLPNSKGLSTLLVGKDSLDEVIHTTECKNLDVIVSGPIPPNPSELLESEEFKNVILELRERYDVVILDTPPIGLVTDARLVLDMSDISLYVVRDRYSKKEFLDIVNRLKHDGVKGLGIVYNSIKSSSQGYGYGNGYGYYK